MSASCSVAPQEFSFTCRRCGKTKTARFFVFWSVKASEAAKKVGIRRTRWGAQCAEDCRTDDT